MAISSSEESFSTEERAAIKERVKELNQQTKNADATADALEKIAALEKPDRSKAARIHALVTEHAPSLAPKEWHGMPSYARNGKIVVFFQAATNVDTPHPALGCNDTARLDDGTMWPVPFAITTLGAAQEKAIAELVQRAAG